LKSVWSGCLASIFGSFRLHSSCALQDGFQKLNLPGEALRGRIRIQYVDHYGEIEAGVDGGGLFKDFMEVLIKEAFDPQIGLFNTTPDQKLYPNSAAAAIVPDAYSMFEFLGKMLGKALYEVGASVKACCVANLSPGRL
jgi:ubiquitin-protein ligase E3 C